MSQIVAPDNRVYVVVGILTDRENRVFIQQRRPGTPKAGKWEFPGGKLEPGETPEQALARELLEELNITIIQSEPLIALAHDYRHARVWLDTYLVTKYKGEPGGHEGQQFAWTDIVGINNFDLLPAVYPIVEALNHQCKTI